MVKLRFLVGLAHKITEIIGTINFPSVRETLGELSSYVSTIEAFVYGMESKGSHYGLYFVPDRALLYAAQVQSQIIYPRVIHLLRELSGGGLLMLPSCVEDFAHPEVGPLIERTQYSPMTNATGRVKFFKLAWDAVGSEFASRHTQYEMFYSGPRTVTTGMAYRTFDWPTATNPVDDFLSTYDVNSDAPPGATDVLAARSKR
jgi:4-hydroxyphenylacetate 3-monooxygenase